MTDKLANALRPVGYSLVGAALLMGASWSLKSAEHAGMLGQDTVERLVGVMIGLMLAIYANFMPKQLPVRQSPVTAKAQRLLRSAGWAFTIAGLGYALMSAFAPMELGRILAMAIVAAALAGTLGRMVWVYVTCAPPRTP